MLGLTFSSKLDCGSYVISKIVFLKVLPRKLELWFIVWSFFLLRLLCLYKSIMQPCMEYCCHVWAGAPSCYFDLLDKLPKWICRTVGCSLPASFEPLAHRWNVANLSLFYRYYFVRCWSELVQFVPLPYSWVWSTGYSGRLHVFSVTICNVTIQYANYSLKGQNLLFFCFNLLKSITYLLSIFKLHIRKKRDWSVHR